jgi:Family of unknown function (DUF5519)
LADASLSKDLQDWILQLPGVSKGPHRFGGTEYSVNGLEFMHSHSPTYLDIRLSLQDQKQILETKRAEPHRFAPQAGWVTLRIRSEKDLATAKEVIMLAYTNAERKMKAHAARQ